MKEEGSELNVASVFVDRPANEQPDRVAIVGEEGTIRLRQLAALANRVGNALHNLNCVAGDRIIIALPDSVEFVASFFGAAKIGAVAVPVNPQARTADFAHYVSDSGARLLIVHASTLPQLSALPITSAQLLVVGATSQLQTGEMWEVAVGNASPALTAYPTQATDMAFFLYTSGSTGSSKAVVHKHKSMTVTTQSCAQSVLAMGPDDRVLSIPRLFYAFGLGNGMYFPLGTGASTILLPEVPAFHKLSRILVDYRPTMLFAVPSYLRAMLREAERGLFLDFSSVRFVVYAGEPSPPNLFQQLRDRLHVEGIEALGSTEMLQNFISNRPGHGRPGTCGVEVPNYEVRLVGDDGEDTASGKPGVLWVKGESAFLEYWRKPEMTTRTKVREWVVTGDRFCRDADGYYHFLGRSDEIVKISGMWVSPIEVETVLSEHPAVAHAVVAPKEVHPGEKQLIAYVVCTENANITVRELRSYLADRLQEHMLPSGFVFLPVLPLNANGKVDRAQLPLPPPSEIEVESVLSDPIARGLAAIWSSILGVSGVTLSDEFLELGGDSIRAMQCLSRIRGVFGVEVSLDSFFEFANFGQLVQHIERLRGSKVLSPDAADLPRKQLQTDLR
jgi:acyl-coenzyme A synthetase/AMP-(fatty) acid ligase/acyl carrier protein